jgi:hypothetical protein
MVSDKDGSKYFEASLSFDRHRHRAETFVLPGEGSRFWVAARDARAISFLRNLKGSRDAIQYAE